MTSLMGILLVLLLLLEFNFILIKLYSTVNLILSYPTIHVIHWALLIWTLSFPLLLLFLLFDLLFLLYIIALIAIFILCFCYYCYCCYWCFFYCRILYIIPNIDIIPVPIILLLIYYFVSFIINLLFCIILLLFIIISSLLLFL